MRFQIKTLNFNFWIFPRYLFEFFTCEWDDSFWFDRAWQRTICTAIRYLMYLTLERHNRCVAHHSCFLDICSYLSHLFLNPRSHTYVVLGDKLILVFAAAAKGLSQVPSHLSERRVESMSLFTNSVIRVVSADSAWYVPRPSTGLSRGLSRKNLGSSRKSDRLSIAGRYAL